MGFPKDNNFLIFRKMKFRNQKNVYPILFSAIYIFIVGLRDEIVDGKVFNRSIRQPNPASNRKPIDAREVMRLITTVDPPTCRCVNVFQTSKSIKHIWFAYNSNK